MGGRRGWTLKENNSEGATLKENNSEAGGRRPKEAIRETVLKKVLTLTSVIE